MDLGIQEHPTFKRLAGERARFGAGMSIIMAVSYFAYILVIAFKPSLLGTALWSGTVLTWGVLVAIGLIAMGFGLTAIYVSRANSRFDYLKQQLLEEVR
jgi:uncharacterized membrane protein (DUF485 family)